MDSLPGGGPAPPGGRGSGVAGPGAVGVSDAAPGCALELRPSQVLRYIRHFAGRRCAVCARACSSAALLGHELLQRVDRRAFVEHASPADCWAELDRGA